VSKAAGTFENPWRIWDTCGDAFPNLIAIDPGLSGGIAIRYQGKLTAQLLPLAGKTLDLAELANIIRQARPTLAIVEKVHAMPGQGVTSMFTFGMGYGAIQGILATLKIPYELVTPQRWKGVVLAGTTKDKNAAIAYCRRAFPNVSLVPPRCRKPHDGIADALCLLEYGRRFGNRG
jgi:crossover junction endodeoxyribonuclease RuvC